MKHLKHIFEVRQHFSRYHKLLSDREMNDLKDIFLELQDQGYSVSYHDLLYDNPPIIGLQIIIRKNKVGSEGVFDINNIKDELIRLCDFCNIYNSDIKITINYFQHHDMKKVSLNDIVHKRLRKIENVKGRSNRYDIDLIQKIENAYK